ncbi:MAG TPA: hypothetical protein VN745_04180 [Verrucomicrobiae bacterium]|nr:hypothetical protein [Verrucomicrobiae bacterium]
MTSLPLKPGYERVYTVNEYYDGPRNGIADYRGEPHLYECIFDESKRNYSELFRLSPIDAQIFQMALEDWEIFRRWELPYHTGKIDATTHPALPNEKQRHQELQSVLLDALVLDPHKSITCIGEFLPIGSEALPKGILRSLQVKWRKL